MQKVSAAVRGQRHTPRTHTRGRTVRLALAVVLMVASQVGAQEADADPAPGADPATATATEPATDAPAQLALRVDGRPLTRAEDVLFFGPRAPRDHIVDGMQVREEDFFTATGDLDLADRARRHRVTNSWLLAGSIVSFFGGIVLFSATRDIPWEAIGLPEETSARGASLWMIGAALVPAITVTIRGQSAMPLEVTFQAMRAYGER